jgi:hypothetical protein
MPNLRDHRIFEVAVTYQYKIREFVSQDETRETGEVGIKTDTIRVIAVRQDYVEAWIKHHFKFESLPDTLTLRWSEPKPFNAFIEEHIW